MEMGYKVENKVFTDGDCSWRTSNNISLSAAYALDCLTEVRLRTHVGHCCVLSKSHHVFIHIRQIAAGLKLIWVLFTSWSVIRGTVESVCWQSLDCLQKLASAQQLYFQQHSCTWLAGPKEVPPAWGGIRLWSTMMSCVEPAHHCSVTNTFFCSGSFDAFLCS